MGTVTSADETPKPERVSVATKKTQLSIGLLVTLLIGTPLAVLVTWPQSFGAQHLLGVAQLIAFRAPLALTMLIAAIVAAVFYVLFRRRARRFASVASGIAIILTAGAIVNGGVLLVRGSSGADLMELPDDDGLTVLVWNTQGGATSPADVAELVLEVQADVVSLPEMDEDAAAEVARLVAIEGMRMTSATTRTIDGSIDESWIPTSLLVADDLGTYELDASAGSTPGLPSGVWRSVFGDGPAIVAAHPAAPLPESMDDWKTGLRWITDQCGTLGPDVILAGDLNATLDHLDLGACTDAAAQAKIAATGTWPSTISAWLASPIDHVLVGPAWTVRDAQVMTPSSDGGTDHRALVAVLGRK